MCFGLALRVGSAARLDGAGGAASKVRVARMFAARVLWMGLRAL